MAPTGPAVHAHAPFKTPNAYVAPMERLDLAMSKVILKKAHNLTYAHLNYLECHGESVFADNNAVNLFVNALRIHWKVTGRTLDNASDQGKDLYELFALEVDGQRIIRNLFTREAIFFLLGRDFPDAMMILAAVVHRIYISQWRSWSIEHTQKNSSLSRYALIISHAQATSNQLSNNVLAFKSNATPELRKWAEETVARHLIAIVTPGHLPPVPSTRNNKYLSGSHDSIPDLKDPRNTVSSSTHLVKYKAASNNYATESGPYNERYEVPFRPNPSMKRKSPSFGSNYLNSPPTKKIKARSSKYRAHDTYRPLGSQGVPFNGHDRPSHRHSDDLLTTPTPIKYVDHEPQALDTPSHEALRKAKLRVLQGKITQHKLDDICVDFADSGLGSSSEGAHEHNTPVVNGPSYTDYLRKKVQDAESPLSINKGNTLGHSRNKSFVGSEEGEIFD
ncbi:hypothetical protein KCU65_g2706, partial [Aureobasidium melanogenum]